MLRRAKKFQGFSVVELLVVIAVITIVLSSVFVFATDAATFTRRTRGFVNAATILQEEMRALLVNKQSLWKSIIDNTEGGEKSLSYTSDTYSIANGPKQNEDYQISFTIDRVFRDDLGTIIYTGGSEDINSRLINFTVSWTGSDGVLLTTEHALIVTNWNTPVWLETIQSDFTNGTGDGIIVTSTNGGALELDLEDEIEPDWCLPFLTSTTYNMQRQGNPTSISAIPNYAYLSTGGNASGPGLDSVSITSDIPPVVTQLDTDSTLSKLNDIYAEPGYVYVTSDDNGAEVGIFDSSNQNNLQYVGYFNASSSTDGNAVWVKGNVGYMTQGSTFRTFDLSSRTGSRPELDSVELIKNGVDMMVVGNYAYIAIQGASIEFQIIDVTNPSNIFAVGQADLNAQSANTVFVNAAGTRAYVGTSNSVSQAEFFIIDTSVKTGNRPIIASYNTNGTTIRDLTVIEQDSRAVLVGTGGEEYQVLDISNELSPSYCGGMQMNQGALGVEGIVDSGNKIWSYVLVDDSGAELTIILGGEFGGGGGGGQGDEYLEEGDYISQVFDTGSTSTQFYSVYWDETLAENTDIQVQIRAGNTADLSAQPWVGPDGTGSTFFTNALGEYTPASINNRRYIQYRVYLTSNKVFTPVLESISINYEN
ncbi:MAG: LVIVD repeat protein [candidate division WS6 bacterium OLB20]|uniref:LVIVD repeat protein n=1 Tax=candidate division WS6 bacterium OLB20 TaxID=1617426 RepID=A0A136M0J3_9BACT|nr:MAG: LVIVD repeat protein [candidate division WS6 bacterium OLB20]